MLEPFRFLRANSGLLLRTAYIELKKRYSGSMVGSAWIVLYPMLFLSMYIFVFQQVFKVRITGLDAGPWQYVLFVFSALVPLLALTEGMTSGCTIVKQNMHLIKNLIAPMELLPLRSAVMACMNMCVGLLLVIALSAANGSLGANILWLPLIFLLQLLFLCGVLFFLAVLGVLFPDLSHIMNVFALMLTFVSPIGFTREMVPPALSAVLYINPVYYMAELYRACIMFNTPPPRLELFVFAAAALGQFLLGWHFFKRFKGTLVDYE